MTEIRCLGEWHDVNAENDNIDVLVSLDDGRVFSFLVATPNNIYWCMENEGIDYYFGTPPLLVKVLDKDCVERAITALLVEDNGRWLEVYGALQAER